MALVVKDRVKETTTTTGTGAISLGGAVSKFVAFSSVLSNGDTAYYSIEHLGTANEFEVGIGTYTSSGNTLTRTTVLASSNSNNAVNFSSGTKEIFITYPADKAVYKDASGNIAIPGTIDGRDLATDGSKLDGIEASATADQTAAEIRTLVESASDSNVFTDADHSKLNAIEANATADQTNVEIRAAVEAASDSNVFTDADHTKLNSIEASADVTDTANVTSAGALMDSEVTNLAQVKAFDSSDYATAAQGSTADAAMPKAGGTFTGDVSHGDNVKAKFGAGSDLQIYHDGSNSQILDSGTGDLFVKNDSTTYFMNAAGTEYKAYFQSNGGSALYFDNSSKLATTTSGISVTGGATLDSDGTLLDFSRVGDAVAGKLKYVDADTGFHFGTTTNHDWYGISNDTKRLKVDNAGLVSFYNGIDVTGNIVVSGTVDGKDVSTLTTAAEAADEATALAIALG